MMEQIVTGGLLLAVVGYFLRGLHTDLKKNTQAINSLTTEMVTEMGKMKGRMELIEKDATLKHEAHVEKTQLQIQQLTENVDKLTNIVEKLIYKTV
jgi:hypothetical protein